jgi:hypothetical protein
MECVLRDVTACACRPEPLNTNTVQYNHFGFICQAHIHAVLSMSYETDPAPAGTPEPESLLRVCSALGAVHREELKNCRPIV